MIELTELDVLKNISSWREPFHATYNGGHHDDGNRRAFHHGMDTVFNVIDAMIKELEVPVKADSPATPPDATPAEGKRVTVEWETKSWIKGISLRLTPSSAILLAEVLRRIPAWKHISDEINSALSESEADNGNG